MSTQVDERLTVPAMAVSFTALIELVEIRGHRLRFKVSCHDGVDLVGEGVHERALIDHARFSKRVAAKARHV